MLNRARPLVAFIAKRRKNVNATPHSVPLGQRTSSNAVQGCDEKIQAYMLCKEPDALHMSVSGSLANRVKDTVLRYFNILSF